MYLLTLKSLPLGCIHITIRTCWQIYYCATVCNLYFLRFRVANYAHIMLRMTHNKVLCSTSARQTRTRVPFDKQVEKYQFFALFLVGSLFQSLSCMWYTMSYVCSWFCLRCFQYPSSLHWLWYGTCNAGLYTYITHTQHVLQMQSNIDMGAAQKSHLNIAFFIQQISPVNLTASLSTPFNEAHSRACVTKTPTESSLHVCWVIWAH